MTEVNRRKFLGMFGKGAAVVAVAPTLFQQVNSTEFDWEDEELPEGLVEERIYEPTSPNPALRARYGMWEQSWTEYKGKTVGEIFDQVKGPWAIPEDAVMFVEGKKVNRSYRLKEYERLEFIRVSGRR